MSILLKSSRSGLDEIIPAISRPTTGEVIRRLVLAPVLFLAKILGFLYVVEACVIASLLPLTVLLLLTPAAIPDESIINETVSRLSLAESCCAGSSIS